MSPSLLLLPSPLLPALAYESLVLALRDLGAEATLAPGELHNGEVSTDLIARWSGLAGTSHLLVAHSIAGYLTPSVRSHSRAAGAVFMDAALPPEDGDTELAPRRFREYLGGLARDDGILPPWTRWWPHDEFDAVIRRDRFEELDRRCPRLPLHYFSGRVTSPADWARDRCAYLAFGQHIRRRTRLRTQPRLATRHSRRWPSALHARPGHRRQPAACPDHCHPRVRSVSCPLPREQRGDLRNSCFDRAARRTSTDRPSWETLTLRPPWRPMPAVGPLVYARGTAAG